MINTKDRKKSFSQEVRNEISKEISSARHCRLAELAAIISFAGHIVSSKNAIYLKFQTESLVIARKYFTLIEKTFNINVEISIRLQAKTNGKRSYTLLVVNEEEVIKILQATKLPYKNVSSGQIGEVNSLVIQKTCCRRSFIRGAFLVSGSITNPEKSYHLEIVNNDRDKAQQLKDLIQVFSIDAKIIRRKKNNVVYVKGGSQIVDLLNLMGRMLL